MSETGLPAARQVRITMLGGFHITCDGDSMDEVVSKTRKGMALMQYLILQHGEQVPVYRLIDALWADESSNNPESALKTLVSRLRVILSQISTSLANCIHTERGSYSWLMQDNVSVDVYEFEFLYRRLTGCNELNDTARADFEQIVKLYGGNIADSASDEEWIVGRSVTLHDQYLQLIYTYLDLLKAAEQYDDIIRVCRVALDVDAFDEQLHLQLMNALVKTSRNNEALMQYKHVTNLHFRYLGVQPPEGILEFYKQIIQAGKTLEMNIDAIRDELLEHSAQSGAFVCEYAVFKEIYNLQMRNLERTGTSMFIGLIMVSGMDKRPIAPLKLNDVMQGLQKVLVSNLRKGDTICQFSATQFALLLPTVNFDSGKMVMERLKRSFYQRYPNSNFMLTYRIGPLSTKPVGPGQLGSPEPEKKS